VGLRACLVRLCRWCGGILDRDERGEELGYLEGENLVFVREEGRGKREEGRGKRKRGECCGVVMVMVCSSLVLCLNQMRCHCGAICCKCSVTKRRPMQMPFLPMQAQEIRKRQTMLCERPPDAM
jgi:hypothetical protein